MIVVLATCKKILKTNSNLQRNFHLKVMSALFFLFDIFSYLKRTAAVPVNQKVVSPSDVDHPANPKRNRPLTALAGAPEGTCAACVTWPGEMAGRLPNSNWCRTQL